MSFCSTRTFGAVLGPGLSLALGLFLGLPLALGSDLVWLNAPVLRSYNSERPWKKWNGRQGTTLYDCTHTRGLSSRMMTSPGSQLSRSPKSLALGTWVLTRDPLPPGDLVE
eukprot:1319582-Amorphochlora_amoeboformis.AAC.1